MTVYLTADEVIGFHERLVGRVDMLRDFGALDGAVSRPQSSVFGEDAFPSIHEKAAALLHGLARNHPFIDGNKRIAWTATAVFYMLNGYHIHMDQGDIVALVVDVAEGQADVQAIAARLKSGVEEIEFTDWPDELS